MNGPHFCSHFSLFSLFTKLASQSKPPEADLLGTRSLGQKLHCTHPVKMDREFWSISAWHVGLYTDCAPQRVEGGTQHR